MDSNSSNGLKFGQKIYFEDDLGGKLVSGSKKNGQNGINNSNNNNNSNPPRCQVEGCNVDLSDAKTYYSRHKVCGMHSKSPLVLVNGLDQRFCQQCSRFHQLPEFDQGKRSCRRRLAGHNERRRKPPPGSLLSSRLGQLSSSLFGDSSTRNGFLLDFSLYSRHSGRDLWPGPKTGETVSGNQSSSLWKFHHNPWPGETSFSVPSGECMTGVATDSACALSLLSNQTWSSTDFGGASVPQPNSSSVTVAHIPVNNNNNNQSWSFKCSNENEAGIGSSGQFSHASNSQFHGDLFIDQVHAGRHYMDHEHDHSRGYN